MGPRGVEIASRFVGARAQQNGTPPSSSRTRRGSSRLGPSGVAECLIQAESVCDDSKHVHTVSIAGSRRWQPTCSSWHANNIPDRGR